MALYINQTGKLKEVKEKCLVLIKPLISYIRTRQHEKLLLGNQSF